MRRALTFAAVMMVLSSVLKKSFSSLTSLIVILCFSLLPLQGVGSNAKTGNMPTSQVHEHPDYRRLIAAMRLNINGTS
jgi:hypothetical protein